MASSSPSSHREIARALALLYAAAGGLGLLNAIVPGYPGFNIPGLLALSGWAFASAAVLFAAPRLSMWALHGFVAQGTLLVCLAIHFTMGVPNAATLFYLWICLYAFYFFSRRAASAHLLLTAGSYAAAIALRPPPFPPVAHWLTTVSTLLIAGLLVGTLKGRLNTTIDQLGAAVAQRDKALDRAERLASTDSLTGLPNRRAWHERFVEELIRANRSQAPFSIALLDLDNFKHLNDSHGHGAGDRLLRQVASLWSEALRETDFLARLGGDEFAVLLPDCDAEQATSVLDRMRQATSAVTYSAGVAVWNGNEVAGDLLKRVDDALYAAKHRGRDQLALA